MTLIRFMNAAFATAAVSIGAGVDAVQLRRVGHLGAAKGQEVELVLADADTATESDATDLSNLDELHENHDTDSDESGLFDSGSDNDDGEGNKGFDVDDLMEDSPQHQPEARQAKLYDGNLELGLQDTEESEVDPKAHSPSYETDIDTDNEDDDDESDDE